MWGSQRSSGLRASTFGSWAVSLTWVWHLFTCCGSLIAVLFVVSSTHSSVAGHMGLLVVFGSQRIHLGVFLCLLIQYPGSHECIPGEELLCKHCRHGLLFYTELGSSWKWLSVDCVNSIKICHACDFLLVCTVSSYLWNISNRESAGWGVGLLRLESRFHRFIAEALVK